MISTFHLPLGLKPQYFSSLGLALPLHFRHPLQRNLNYRNIHQTSSHQNAIATSASSLHFTTLSPQHLPIQSLTSLNTLSLLPLQTSKRFLVTPKQSKIVYSYAATPFENPQSYSRSTRNLPDEYITPLAESPEESYSILNELQQHPIRYRSWNSFLQPEYRPSSVKTSNDYIPQATKFEATKTEEIDPWDNIFATIANSGFFMRGVGTAIVNSGPENMAKLGLLMSTVLLYAKYGSGKFGDFDYDDWVDSQFRSLLIFIDQQFRIGARIDTLEKQWDRFEHDRIHESTLPSSQQPVLARFYFWCRDVLFNETFREHSDWKQRKQLQNESVSLRNVKDELFTTTPVNSTPLPQDGTPLNRHQQRDQELIAVDTLRLQMVRENRGMALNRTQEYLLRHEFKRIAREYADLEEQFWAQDQSNASGLSGLDEMQYEVFMQEQVEKEKELSKSRSNNVFERHEIRDQMNAAQHDQNYRETQLDSLANVAQQKRLEYEINRNQLTTTSKNPFSQPIQRSEGLFGFVSSIFSPFSSDSDSSQSTDAQQHNVDVNVASDVHDSVSSSQHLDDFLRAQQKNRSRREHALNMMQQEDMRIHEKVAPNLQRQHEEELYGEIIPSRRTMNEIQTQRMENLQASSLPQQNPSLNQQQQSSKQSSNPTKSNPFPWLSRRDEIDQQSSTINPQQHHQQPQQLLEDEGRHQPMQSSFNGSTSPLDPTYSPTSAEHLKKQQIEEDKHVARLNRGLFGSLFGK